MKGEESFNIKTLDLTSFNIKTIFEKANFLNINNMAENKNLKALNERIKQRPLIGQVARFAGISHSHLCNIAAGRRKVSPELKKKIDAAYRRVLR